MRTLVVVPTYNEADTIAHTLERLFAATSEIDVLVVDDGSPDGTAAIANALAADHPNHIHVMERDGKRGLGTAYIAGFTWALEKGYDAIVEMDADGSHDPADVPRLLAALADGADLVIGSRYVDGGGVSNWSRGRRRLSRAGNVYAHLMLGLDVKDATSGFRALRAATVDASAERNDPEWWLRVPDRSHEEGPERGGSDRRGPDHVRGARGRRLQDVPSDRARGGRERRAVGPQGPGHRGTQEGTSLGLRITDTSINGGTT